MKVPSLNEVTSRLIVGLVAALIGLAAHATDESPAATAQNNDIAPSKAGPYLEPVRPTADAPEAQKTIDAATIQKFALLLKSKDPKECMVSTTAGASGAVQLDSIFKNGCSYIRSEGAPPTATYYFNCCANSAWIRVNQLDWDRLRAQGKLDGIRYLQVSHDSKNYKFHHKKIKGSTITFISPEPYLP